MIFATFNEATKHYHDKLVTSGVKNHTGKWQGIDISEKIDAQMVSLTLESFEVPLRPSLPLSYWQNDIKPNLPWADDHFEERVQGEPLNPGKEWTNWPWGNSANVFRDGQGQFNHNYMERYWSKYAGQTDQGEIDQHWIDGCEILPNRGIREGYGDLDDLVDLLVKEPDTRQAYFPVYHPEDVGYREGARKPCSIGYHFLLRYPYLHIVYQLRSCDFTRHFRDDMYLTLRLLFWVIEKCKKSRGGGYWRGVIPGKMQVHISDLHVFINDHLKMCHANDRQEHHLP